LCSLAYISKENPICNQNKHNLQYPHFIKRKTNSVQLLLQRRRRVKNRPIPGGFKTIATGAVNLTDVLQTNVDREMCMYSPAELASGAADDIFAQNVHIIDIPIINHLSSFAAIFLRPTADGKTVHTLAGHTATPRTRAGIFGRTVQEWSAAIWQEQIRFVLYTRKLHSRTIISSSGKQGGLEWGETSKTLVFRTNQSLRKNCR
jgi:hypothetical protein